MQPQPRAYLSSLRREMRNLTAKMPAQASATGLNYCIDQTVAQLIARDEFAAPLIAEFEAELRHRELLTAGSMASIAATGAIERRLALLGELEKSWQQLPANSAERARFEAAAMQADNRLRKAYLRAAEQVAKEIEQSPTRNGWNLSTERIEPILGGLRADWIGAKVCQMKPLAGIHAKEIYFLDLQLVDGNIDQVVVRCDREVDLTRSSVANEFPLLKALYARGFQIPEPLAVVQDKAVLGQAALFMRKVAGSEKSIVDIRDPVNLLKEAAQFLAKLHATPKQGTGLEDVHETDALLGMWHARIDAHFDWWHEVATEPAPVMWCARRWLNENVHLVTNAASVVHGDFNLRNLLVNDQHGLASVLDWEFAHIGHPAVDLGYMRETVESVMSWDDFAAMYRAAGGSEVTRQQTAFFDIWGLYRNIAIDATAQHYFLNGQTTECYLGTAVITYYPQLLTLLSDALDRAA